MNFKVNLETELLGIKTKILSEKENLVGTAQNILGDSLKEDQEFMKKMGLQQIEDYNSLVKSQQDLNRENVFDILSIKKICLKYNLKFFQFQYYAKPIPFEVIQNLKSQEKRLGLEFYQDKMFIIAPKSHAKKGLGFPAHDPLLFYELDSEHYLFVKKWGHDLNLLRRLNPFKRNLSFYILYTAILIPLFLNALLFKSHDWLGFGILFGILVPLFHGIMMYGAFGDWDYRKANI